MEITWWLVRPLPWFTVTRPFRLIQIFPYSSHLWEMGHLLFSEHARNVTCVVWLSFEWTDPLNSPVQMSSAAANNPQIMNKDKMNGDQSVLHLDGIPADTLDKVCTMLACLSSGSEYWAPLVYRLTTPQIYTFCKPVASYISITVEMCKCMNVKYAKHLHVTYITKKLLHSHERQEYIKKP